MFITKSKHNRIVAGLESRIATLNRQLESNSIRPEPEDEIELLPPPAPKLRYITLTFEDGTQVKHQGITYQIRNEENADGGIAIRANDYRGVERTVAWYNKIPKSIISTWE
jgi:hypothetical protein